MFCLLAAETGSQHGKITNAQMKLHPVLYKKLSYRCQTARCLRTLARAALW